MKQLSSNMISAVLINFNEAQLLERCLESIKNFVSEIVVIDLGSTDQSSQVFKKYGVRVVKHDWVPYADPIRNFAINQAKGGWILMLDPDEVVPESLQETLKKIVQENNPIISAVNMPFKNIFFGKWISHTNFWPDKHLRFFRKGKLKWRPQVHSYPQLTGEILEIPAVQELAVIHQSYKTWGQFLNKQFKYAKIEAENRKGAGDKFSFFRLIWLPAREFLARFVKHQGYLDGVNGVFLVVVLMWYHVLVEWYLLKMSNTTNVKYPITN